MNLDSAFFLFCFLPLLTVIYFLVRGIKGKNLVIVIAGLIFYAFGSLGSLALLLLSAVINYAFGLLLSRSRGGNASKALAFLAVALNVAFLGAYKYLSFFLSDLIGLDSVSVTLVAPLGISFFTFRAISYIVDIKRNPDSSAKSFFGFLAYMTFFPQIISGPIARFSDFEPQLTERKVSAHEAASGLVRFIFGLSEKLLISAPLGIIADEVFSSGSMDIRLAWVGAIAYSLELFFDFSGYSDMAIGLGGMFGFTSPENFNFPYISGSITEFWRRWHISLSSWFRDYVYIPLGGNRRGRLRTALNKIIVFLLCGLWHGAAFTYIVWGALHALLSALESLKVINTERLSKTLPGRVLCHVYTLVMVVIGFVIFRAVDLGSAFSMIGSMLTGFTISVECTVLLHSLINAKTVTVALLAVLFSVPLPKKLWGRVPEGTGKSCALYAFGIILLVLCIGEISAGSFSPFIYAQF